MDHGLFDHIDENRRRSVLLIAVSILLGAHVVAPPASAQAVCGDRNQVISDLARHHAETPMAIGLSASGHLIELPCPHAMTLKKIATMSATIIPTHGTKPVA